MTTPPVVLFVDDEPNVLHALRRLLRKEPYSCLFAADGAEALALIEGGERPVVIVSDQKMPGMNGAEFLAQTRSYLPESIRIILTGYAEVEIAMEAINCGGVARYLTKPWQDEELLFGIREAVERYELARQNRMLTEALQIKNILLEAKNAAIEDLNANLEHKVLQRTEELRKAYQENIELTKELKKKIRELEGRDRIQQHLLTIHPLPETLQVVMEVIEQVVGVDGVLVHLEDEEGLRAVGALGAASGELGSSEGRQPQTAVVEEAVRQRQPVNVQGPRLVMKGVAYETYPFAVAPILSGEKCIGAIEVDRRVWGEPLGNREVEVIVGFSMQAAIGIRDSQLSSQPPAWDAALDEVIRDFQ